MYVVVHNLVDIPSILMRHQILRQIFHDQSRVAFQHVAIAAAEPWQII